MTQVSKRLPKTPRQAAKRAGPLDSLLDPELFRALGDPTRVRLLACLAKCGRACGVGEVAECCSVDLSVVSRHLSLLADAGVLAPKKEGRSVSYALRATDLSTRLRALADAIDACCPEAGGGGCGEGCACGSQACKGGGRGCC